LKRIAAVEDEINASKGDTSLILRVGCVIVWAIAIIGRYGKACVLRIASCVPAMRAAHAYLAAGCCVVG